MKKTAKKKKAPKFEFAEPLMVTWRDTSGAAAWASLHEPLPEPPHVAQLGFFISADKDTFRICQGLPFYEGEEETCQILAPSSIPIGCIVDVKRLKRE